MTKKHLIVKPRVIFYMQHKQNPFLGYHLCLSMTALCPSPYLCPCPCPCCGCDGGEICALSCVTSSCHDCGSDAFCQSARGCVSSPGLCPGSYRQRKENKSLRKQMKRHKHTCRVMYEVHTFVSAACFMFNNRWRNNINARGNIQ